MVKKTMVKAFQKRPGFSCNVYVLSSGKGTVLVDPGFYDRHIRRHLEACAGQYVGDAVEQEVIAKTQRLEMRMVNAEICTKDGGETYLYIL